MGYSSRIETARRSKSLRYFGMFTTEWTRFVREILATTRTCEDGYAPAHLSGGWTDGLWVKIEGSSEVGASKWRN